MWSDRDSELAIVTDRDARDRRSGRQPSKVVMQLPSDVHTHHEVDDTNIAELDGPPSTGEILKS